MSTRSTNLARSRRRAAGRVPTTVLARIGEDCRQGLHLWCTGTVAANGTAVHECLCDCHTGHKVPAPGVES